MRIPSPTGTAAATGVASPSGVSCGAGVPTGAPNGAMASWPYFIAAERTSRGHVRGRRCGAFDNRFRHAFMLERTAHIERRRLDDMADIHVVVIDANLAGENDAALGAKIVKARRQVRGERAVGRWSARRRYRW